MTLFILFCWLLTIVPMTADAQLSAYQVLEEYNFPEGILPQGVSGYNLDPSSGLLTVYMGDSCSFKIERYKVKYSSQVCGIITENALIDIDGVRMKFSIFKLRVSKVTRDGDDLKFSARIFSSHVSVSNFYGIPQCGCGFYCSKAYQEKPNSSSLNSTLS